MSDKPNPFKFELLTEVKEKITGFTGTITARCESLEQIQYQIEPQAVNGQSESIWFTEGRLEAIESPAA